MFRSLRPKPPPPLPLPFRDKRAEAERERKRAVERFANVEMDRAEGFSWSNPPPTVPLGFRLSSGLRANWRPALGAVGMGVALVGAFLALSRLGLAEPPPTIIYVEDWSGRPDLDAPVAAPPANDPEAARAAALARERAAARAASPES
jgi:hypothetical protein